LATNSLWLTPLALVFLTSVALGHDLGDQREVIISISPIEVEMLILYEVPAGQFASQLREWMDLNGDGTISDQGFEALARAQVLVPRAGSGLDIQLDGRPIEMVLQQMSFQDGAGEAEEQGVLAMLRYVSQVDAAPLQNGTLTLSTVENVARASVRIQVTGGLLITESTVPPASDAPVVGPVNLVPEMVTGVSFALPGLIPVEP